MTADKGRREIRQGVFDPRSSIIIPNFGRDLTSLIVDGIDITHEINEISNVGDDTRLISPYKPVLQLEQHAAVEGVGLYDRGFALGGEEVIEIKYGPTGLESLLKIFKSRSIALENSTKNGKLRQFFASATYSQGKLVGRHLVSERIAPAIDYAIQKSSAYYDYKKRCMFCDIRRQEQNTMVNEESRVIFLDKYNNGYLGFVPFDPPQEYYLTILPLKHVLRLKELSDEEIKNLAFRIYQSIEILNYATKGQRVDVFLYSTPLSHPKAENLEKSHHFYVRAVPEGTQNEIRGTGWYVVTKRPKDVAGELRGFLEQLFSNH